MKLSTRGLVLTALFTALTCVGAFISIPIGPVPITLQTLFVILSALILGPKLAALSQITYVLLGLTGLPVFAGFKGGMGHIFSPTFGFLISFVVVSYLIGKLTEKDKSLKRIILSVFLGSIVIYVIGIPYFLFILNSYLGKSMDLYTSLSKACIPFIPGDIIKAVIAIILSNQVLKRLPKESYNNLKY